MTQVPSPWHDLDRYVAMPRLTGAQVAPDGSWLLVSVSVPDVEVTSYVTQLWKVPTDGQGRAVRLTRGSQGEQAAAILGDGSVIFTSKRDLPPIAHPSEQPPATEPEAALTECDDDQALWCLPAGGGEAYVMTRRLGGFEGVFSARHVDRLICPIRVQRGVESLTADAQRRRDRKANKVDAILHTGYPVRYWDHDLGSETVRFLGLDLPEGEVGDLTLAQDDCELLTSDLGSGLSSDAALADDGSFLVTTDAVAEPHGFRRNRLVRIDTATGELTTLRDEPGVEWMTPVISPDATLVACVREQIATCEQVFDQPLHLLDLTTMTDRPLAPEWDRWATPIGFSPDQSVLYVTADEDGECPIFEVTVADGSVRRLTDHGAFSSVTLSTDGSHLYGLRSAYDDPGSVWAIDIRTGDQRRLSSPVSYPELPGRLERVETTASDGTRVPGWLCLPEAASSPAPLALWIHGGPLNSWNAWSWRWCPWLLVSRGYAVLLPDPALSTGYGLDFIQRGWGRWGAESYTDLMALTDEAELRADIDQQRTVAMGGSYGGYMANWVAGHTDRFKAIVTHASLWNLTSFGGATDAAWYWDIEMSPEMAEANSPHRFIDQITTPMLVIHGDKDYRVPIGEGLTLWWQLNKQWSGDPADLPHKFLYFPHENHWVLTPQHAKLWYATVVEFLASQLEQRPFVAPELL